MTTTTAANPLSGLLAPGDKLLRLSLRLDAVVTGVNGLAYLVLAGPIESLLGLDSRIGIGIGLFLLVYAAGVGLVGAPASINVTGVRAVVVGNIAWSIVSLAALATGVLDLKALGAVWTVMQAAVVGGFAALQVLGLRKAR